jgi:hypothetical protein
MRQILQIMESEGLLRPSATEYEMAYQARVAIDRIRFAIRQTEQAGGRADQVRETAMQLLDALNRLESVERRFQQRARYSAPNRNGNRREIPSRNE